MRIRSLALAAALALPGLAGAAPSPAPSPAPAPRSPSADAAPKEDTAHSKEEMAEAEKRLMDSFKGQQNFQLQGKLLGADAEHGSIILQREQMPMALLIVPDSAKVSVNGKKSTLADLQPGDDVRATFNLAQQYPIALEVNATQSPGGAKKPSEPSKPAPGEPPAPPTPPKSK